MSYDPLEENVFDDRDVDGQPWPSRCDLANDILSRDDLAEVRRELEQRDIDRDWRRREVSAVWLLIGCLTGIALVVLGCLMFW